MSKYTMTLDNIINFMSLEEVEKWFKDYDMTDYLTNEEIEVINARGTWNKDKLARKIIENYRFREIGFETIALFKHYLSFTLKNIMESKLPLIYSASIKYDPLVNVDYKEEYQRKNENTGSSTGNSTNTSSGLSVSSDTPQGQISKTEILQGKYASSTGAGESTNTANDTNSTTSNTNENWSRTMRGNAGISATAQKMIEQYRDNIRAIDYEIIKELNSLFMGLY